MCVNVSRVSIVMRIEYGHRTHQECSYCHFEIARKVEKHMYSIHANPAHRIYDERQDWLCYVDLCWRVANGDTQCCLIPRSELTRTHRHTRVRKVSSANHFYSTLHLIWIECLIKNIFGRNYSRFLRHSSIWEPKNLEIRNKTGNYYLQTNANRTYRISRISENRAPVLVRCEWRTTSWQSICRHIHTNLHWKNV